jgi:hypothetical protein
MGSISDYLNQQVDSTPAIYRKPDFKYWRFEQLVLDCGREMQPDENSSSERGRTKSCYWNCQQLVSKQPELIYCEGFAVSQNVGFPLSHAWLLNSAGKVLEPTWEFPGEAYLGVAFSWEWIRSLMKSRQQRGRDNDLSVFECNYLEEYSLLKEGLPPDAYYQLRGD